MKNYTGFSARCLENHDTRRKNGYLARRSRLKFDEQNSVFSFQSGFIDGNTSKSCKFFGPFCNFRRKDETLCVCQRSLAGEATDFDVLD
jgi:hypothetical protein